MYSVLIKVPIDTKSLLRIFLWWLSALLLLLWIKEMSGSDNINIVYRVSHLNGYIL